MIPVLSIHPYSQIKIAQHCDCAKLTRSLYRYTLPVSTLTAQQGNRKGCRHEACHAVAGCLLAASCALTMAGPELGEAQDFAPPEAAAGYEADSALAGAVPFALAQEPGTLRVLRFKEEHSGAWADHVPATSARDAGDATAPAGPEPGPFHTPRSEREHSGARADAVHPTHAGEATAPDNEPLALLVQKLGRSAPADCNRPLLAAVNENHGAPRQPAPDLRRAAQDRACYLGVYCAWPCLSRKQRCGLQDLSLQLPC